ncbi:MAG: hypothetical protein M3Y33_06750, partial [Actinomycetota bacterium]|nr:hypothetical protein [Actinomycetota bacterium]
VGLPDPAGDPANPAATSASGAAGAASVTGDAQLAGTAALAGLALLALSHGELLSYAEPPLSHDGLPFPFGEPPLA